MRSKVPLMLLGIICRRGNGSTDRSKLYQGKAEGIITLMKRFALAKRSQLTVFLPYINSQVSVALF